MATEQYRNYRVWEEALSLSQRIHGLAESLPSNEQSALAVSLNASMVNIPTIIALNLLQDQPADLSAVVGLQTQLELINRVYPALDTAELERAASALLIRLQDGGQFKEALPQPQPPAQPEADEDVEDDEDGDEDDESEDSADASQTDDSDEDYKTPDEPINVTLE